MVPSMLLGAGGVILAALLLGRDDLRVGAAVGLFGLAALGTVAVWSTRRGRHTPWSEAERQITPEHGVVLWKPGCVHCERLLLALRREPRLTWVNVWRDEEANHAVRARNDGDELTPTVLVGDQVLRNPPPGRVRAALDGVGH